MTLTLFAFQEKDVARSNNQRKEKENTSIWCAWQINVVLEKVLLSDCCVDVYINFVLYYNVMQ